MLHIQCIRCGEIEENAYLITDADTGADAGEDSQSCCDDPDRHDRFLLFFRLFQSSSLMPSPVNRVVRKTKTTVWIRPSNRSK